jgi:hypothetical protein
MWTNPVLIDDGLLGLKWTRQVHVEQIRPVSGLAKPLETNQGSPA